VNYDEGNIKLLVEQVLAELSKSANIQTIVGNAEKAFAESSGPDNSSCSDDGILEDLSAIDIREWFLVKDPIDETLYKEIKATTIARIGLGRAGSRQLTKPQLRMLADHAMAQDSVFTELSDGFLDRFDMLMLHSAAKDKEEYLKRPDLGRILNAESLEILRRDGTKGADVQIIISDGLSSKALEANLPDLLPALIQGLKSLGLKVGMPVFVKFGRVALMDQIGEELKPKAAIILVGERPGLPTAESLSAYFGYNPRVGMVESERTCNSNIHKGQPPSTIAPILSRDVPAQLSSERLLWHQTFFLLIAHCSYQTLLVFLPPPPSDFPYILFPATVLLASFMDMFLPCRCKAYRVNDVWIAHSAFVALPLLECNSSGKSPKIISHISGNSPGSLPIPRRSLAKADFAQGVSASKVLILPFTYAAMSSYWLNFLPPLLSDKYCF
jgi:ethanolamine ammonia-lyase small subunit